MTGLEKLFPEGPRNSRAAVMDDHHSVDRLRRMFGAPRSSTNRALADTDVPALVAAVTAAQKDAAAQPQWETTPRSGSGRRARRRRLDPVNTVAGGLAAISVIALAVFGGVQTANANPAASALRGLGAAEALLENSADSVRNAHVRLTDRLAAEATEAAAYRAMLDLAGPVTDVNGNPAALADADALAAGLAEADAYLAALGQFVVPVLPADYERGDIDERSITEIAEAVDETQTLMPLWDAARAEIVTAGSDLDALVAAHTQQRDSFAAAFEGYAATLVAAYADRPSDVRTPVVTAAGQVVASKLLGSAGSAALTAYRNAAEQLVNTLPPAPEPIPQPWNQQSSGGTGGTGEETTPSPEPTTPTDPVDPVEPEPEEPQPTEPPSEDPQG